MINKGSRSAGGRRASQGAGAVTALIASGIAWGTSVPLSKVALAWLAPGWLTVARFGLASGAEAVTLKTRGQIFRLSRERVRQIVQAALRLLRQAAGGGRDSPGTP